jgi:amino acid adenylation domain-containing protein
MTPDKNIESIYLLSPMQEGMLFHTLYAPESSVYFEQFRCTLHGNINRNAFKQAWKHVVVRHSVLRTLVILKKGNKPRQLVRKRVKLPWIEHDWRGLTSTVRQARLETFLKEDREQGFVLDQAPLIRCALIQIADDIYYFVLASHHLLMDGWSSAILFKEVFTCYKAFCQGQEAYLPKPHPYRDYIAWLQQQDLSKAETFWKEQLKGFTAPTPFRVDKLAEKSSPAEEKAYEEQRFSLGPNTTEALQSVAQTHRLTLNTLVQGAWSLLLSRYSGFDDVVFGATVSDRPAALAGVESMVGLFINTLPVRVSVSPELLLLPWLTELHTKQVEREAYSYTPLVSIQGWSEVQSGVSLFESLLVFENYPVEKSLRKGGIGSISISEVQTIEKTNYPLTLVAFVSAGELKFKMSYVSNRFETIIMTRMMRHLKTLLEGMITQPETKKLGEIPLLTAAEQQQLLAWNDTAVNYPDDKTIVDLFEEQVAKTPNAIAVVFENQQLTYQELNSQANQVAHYLQTLGVKPEILVGICVERSIEMVIGLFGILKAGGAYVPLDPAYPLARLAFMLEDAEVPVLLTQESLKKELPETKAQVVCLEAKSAVLSRSRSENIKSGVTPTNLAYVIYTSGSTGKPKGVQIGHSSLLNFLTSMGQQPGLTSNDILLAITTLSFDIAALEIYLPLLKGAKIVLASREKAYEGSPLLNQLKNEEITILQATPATWHLLIAAGWKSSPQLKILCGGEACSPELARQLLEKGQSVWNLYGPTETTIWSTMARITTAITDTSVNTISIGHPIANTQVYLLDSYLQRVPIGVPGELHIGGAGLARGYINRPDLTAEKFIKNPFSDDPDARLYKTGDLARYLPDGNIEYLGRLDNQIKIRGFRIELGEIEAVLTTHPFVTESVVIVHEYSQDDQRLVAYLVPNQGQEIENSELRAFLEEQLPDYMIPSVFVTLEFLPLTPNGKIDRRALPEPEGTRPQLETAYVMPQTEVERQIAQVWQKVLQLEKVGLYDNFFDVGGHSLLMIRVHGELQTLFGQSLGMVKLFQYPTIHALAEHLTSDETQKTFFKTSDISSHKDIAIIGMSGRFPGAQNVDIFWQNLSTGVESITFFSDEELLAEGIAPDLLNNPNYVKAKGMLEDIELFDAAFFGFSPREAETIDPQQRLFLECAWEAIENAGYDVERTNGAVGIYAGSGMNNYFLDNIISNPELLKTVGSYQIRIANKNDHLATRTSYKLNLKGPSISIQTTCSTSLVAINLACQSLLDGKCDMALAGGVTLSIPPKTGYMYQPDMIASPDGHCRAFDAKAQGTVGGSGVGIVVLKRLDQALTDGDCIHAVIKGSAINNDGALKVGYTASSVDGQAAVIAEAMQNIDPSTITYVETHGTGTTLGDPIEIAALTQAYQSRTQKKGFCAIGSVKTNVGHLDTAAGVTGLIKTVLALKHKMLPPSLHFKQPNPKIDFANSPFFVNTTLSEWKSEGMPRRAGVSSFGIGGTNAHLILEETPVQLPISREKDSEKLKGDTHRPWQLLVLSAKTQSALEMATTNLADHLKQHPDINFADVAYTLSQGRKIFEHRRLLVCQTLDEATEVLSTLVPERIFTQATDAKARPVVFMFSGQGSQYVNMAWKIYQHEPIFREQVDKCAEILKPHLNLDLREVLYPSSETNEIKRQLEQTAIAQPALFTIEYALAQLWMAWGLHPVAMIGHSIGEYVAACLAGVFSLEEALVLVAVRGRLMQSLPEGAMLSVPLPETEVKKHLNQALSFAVHNAPSQCVVSGTIDAITALENQLIAQDVECRWLQTSHAFHSAMMEPILAPFTAHVRKMRLNPPQIPYLSNVNGTWITTEQATEAAYWAKHLRSTVRFSEGLQVLLEKPESVLLEIGPGRTLATLVGRQPNKNVEQVVLYSLRHPNDHQADGSFLLTTLGKLWLAGVPIDWSGFYAQELRQRLPLPTYPFERQRYWIEPADSLLDVSVKPDIADWFYIPIWQREIAPVYQSNQILARTNWLVFTDECGLGSQLVKRLEQANIDAITVCLGTTFNKLSDRVYTINPSQTNDYETLFNELAVPDKLPKTIVHLWSVTSDTYQLSDDSYHKTQQLGFYSLLFIAQALWKHSVTTKFQIEVVSNQIQAVTGEESLYPEKATVLGPVKVIPQEYSNINCRSIDIVMPKSDTESKLVEQLLAEFTSEHRNNSLPIAFRGPYRWSQSFAAQRLEKPNDSTIGLRRNGVYLITGGLGGLGLVFAEYLAKTVQAKLVLVSRSRLPAKEEWAQLLSNEDQPISLQKPSHMLDIATEVDAINQMETALKTELGIQLLSSYPGLEATFNELCSSYIYDYLARHINTDKGKIYNRVDLKDQLKILPKFDKFYHFMLKVLAEDGIIKAEAGHIEFLKVSTAIKDAEQLRIAAEQSYPDLRGSLAYLDHCVSHYREALSGEIEAISVLYPQGRTDFLKETRNNTQKSGNHLYVTLLREIIAKVIENSPRKKLRILEVGAGNGSLTYTIVPMLNQYNAEYHFTDLGKFFVLNAEKQAEKMDISHFMHFGVLDISKDASQQGYDYYSFDLILGLNVVHATKNISETLAHLKKLLAPHGLLCLIETVKQQRWVDMVWGLAEGWWYFEDEEIRTDSPLLNITQWENVLEKQGFQSVKAYPNTLPQRDETDCALFIAQQPNLMTDSLLEPSTVLDETQRLQDKIRFLTALEKDYGTEIMVLSADVADFAQMQSVYTQATAQFGDIHGVIHAAAIEGGSTIQVQVAEMAKQEFSPKMKGTRTLEKVFKPAKLDFMMLCSSHSAIIGGKGQVGYCAANAFLDAYAHAKATESDTLIVSIDWDRWQNIEMTANVEAKHLAKTGEALTGGLTAEEDFQAFSRILSKKTLSQVIVSKRNFINFLTVPSVKGANEKEKKEQKITSTHGRPNLPNAYIAPRSKVEQIMTDIWQEVLGIEPIGVYDDFYDLGGDSLIAIRMISQLRESLEVELTVRDLFEKTTVVALAEYIATSLIAPVSNDNLNDYLEEEEL